MGVLPFYNGILCHDYYVAYFEYEVAHALCNSHHLRELERSIEHDNHNWSRSMKALLIEINEVVDMAGGILEESNQKEI